MTRRHMPSKIAHLAAALVTFSLGRLIGVNLGG